MGSNAKRIKMKRKEIRKKIPVAVVSADKEIIELTEESRTFEII